MNTLPILSLTTFSGFARRHSRAEAHTTRAAFPMAPAMTLALALAVGGCASQSSSPTRPQAPVTQAGPAATPSAGGAPTSPALGADGKPAPASSTLAAERKYLQDWFGGTPVTIDLDRDGVLRVEVPLQNAFDAQQHKPKPALAKVLEHVATSLRRVPSARVAVSAPSDPGRADAALVERRQVAVREAIVARGVNAIRVGAVGATAANPLPTATAAPMVSIRISIPAAP